MAAGAPRGIAASHCFAADLNIAAKQCAVRKEIVRVVANRGGGDE